jgi:hypothetical protein
MSESSSSTSSHSKKTLDPLLAKLLRIKQVQYKKQLKAKQPNPGIINEDNMESDVREEYLMLLSQLKARIAERKLNNKIDNDDVEDEISSSSTTEYICKHCGDCGYNDERLYMYSSTDEEEMFCGICFVQTAHNDLDIHDHKWVPVVLREMIENEDNEGKYHKHVCTICQGDFLSDINGKVHSAVPLVGEACCGLCYENIIVPLKEKIKNKQYD